MKVQSIRRMVRCAGLILPLTWLPLPGSADAQARGKSTGVAVSTPTVNQQTPTVDSPVEGGLAQDQAATVDVGTYVTGEDAFAVASGESDGSYSDAVSAATLESVSVLGGLITADAVVAIATSTANSRNADGSGFVNLVVNGVAMSDPAPNTRVDLPNVGYVVLNEQITKGGGITVNMIHVVMKQGGGSKGAGDIIVGSASSN
jgi:hypothetical protein